jgi:hypothetical protein
VPMNALGPVYAWLTHRFSRDSIRGSGTSHNKATNA